MATEPIAPILPHVSTAQVSKNVGICISLPLMHRATVMKSIGSDSVDSFLALLNKRFISAIVYIVCPHHLHGNNNYVNPFNKLLVFEDNPILLTQSFRYKYMYSCCFHVLVLCCSGGCVLCLFLLLV